MTDATQNDDHHGPDIDDHTGVETTGHEWDGIKELNNPLPRWWLYIWYASIVYAIVYWVLMPSWPALPGTGGSHLMGLRGHSDRAAVAAEMEALRSERADSGAALIDASLDEIVADGDLLQFALASGESAFGDNCATCHGAGGRGAKGYPVLADDIWLWDGTLDGIEYTLRHGIRHMDDADTRYSAMPAFGRDGLLDDGQIDDLVQHVLAISGHEDIDRAAADRGASLFAQQCASCHSEDGTGMRMFGAPNLTDADWQFGGSPREIQATIYNARNAHMPAWQDRLDDATVKALAVYVHALGGGE